MAPTGTLTPIPWFLLYWEGMAHNRTTASLLAAGAATITLDHRMERLKLQSTLAALRADRKALTGDGLRVKRQLAGAIDHR